MNIPSVAEQGLRVRQITNPLIVRISIVVNIIAYFLLWYLHEEYPETVPEIYWGGIFLNGYLFHVLRKSMKDPHEGKNNLEFYRDPIVLLLLMLLPSGIAYLLFTYVLSVSPPMMVFGYICSVVIGFIILIDSAGYKIVLKEHTVTFTHGVFFRRQKAVPYGNIASISISAATDGITITTKDGKIKETYRWMGGLGNLQKLLRHRVEAAPVLSGVGGHDFTLEELADRRVRGVIADEEFSAELQKRYAESTPEP